MKLLATLLSLFLLVSAVLASGHGGFHTVVIQPQVVKVIKQQPVHVVKVVKAAPPPVPVVKYIKHYHSSSYGHPFHHHW